MADEPPSEPEMSWRAGRSRAGGAAARVAARAAARHARRRRPAAPPTRSIACDASSRGSIAGRRSSSPGSSAPTASTAITRRRLRHALGRSTPDLLALRAGRADRRAGPGARPGLARAGAGGAAALQLAAGRGRPVRRRDLGRRRPVPRCDAFAGVVALDLRRLGGLVELDEESRLATLGPGLRGPEAEELLGRARLHARTLPAVVRVRDARRVRGDPLQRPGVGGLRALRRPGDGDAGRDPGRHARARPRAALRRRPGPAPADARLRRRLRGDHVADGGRPAGRPPRASTRAGASRRSPTGAAGASRARAGRTRADRAAALRRGRDGAQPRRPRPDRRRPARRLPGDRRLRGRRGGRATRAGPAARALAGHGAQPVPDAGDSWSAGRYRAPYLRDALLDAGVLVETLETACFWSSLHELHAGVSVRGPRRADGPGHAAGDPRPRLARVSGGRLAVLHRRLPRSCPIRSRSGGRRRSRPATRSRPRRDDHPPPRGRDRSSCRGMNVRSASSASRRCARSSGRSIRRASSIPAC